MGSVLSTAVACRAALLLQAPHPGSCAAETRKYERSVADQDGKKVRLASLLNGDQPVIVDFIYGTCTTICPVLSAGLANLQRRLGPGSDPPLMPRSPWVVH